MTRTRAEAAANMLAFAQKGLLIQNEIKEDVMTRTRAEAAAAMLEFAQKGLLVQMYWRKKEGGRELACLLAAAIGPEMDGVHDCPAAVMPKWMAHLLVRLSDGVPANKVASLGIRFAEALRDGNADDDVLRRWFIRVIEYAVVAAAPKVDPAPDYWALVVAACEQAIAALRSADRDDVALEAAARAALRAAEAAGQAMMLLVRARAQAASGAAHVAHAAVAAARAWASPVGWEAGWLVGWVASEAAWATGAARADGPAGAAVAYEALFIALIEEMERA